MNTEKEQEKLQFARSLSPHKLQYTSGKNVPMTPTPSRSSTEADRNTAKLAFSEDPVGVCAQSPTGSTNHDEETSFSRNQLAALYHRYNPQKIFENRGSTARDHLASERTFLAYVRTSLSLASTGVALVQLFTVADLTSRTANTLQSEASKRVQKFARPLGVTTVAMALIMLGIAVYRYFLIQGALPGNMFPVARFSVIFTTFVLSAVVVVIFAVLLGGR